MRTRRPQQRYFEYGETPVEFLRQDLGQKNFEVASLQHKVSSLERQLNHEKQRSSMFDHTVASLQADLRAKVEDVLVLEEVAEESGTQICEIAKAREEAEQRLAATEGDLLRHVSEKERELLVAQEKLRGHSRRAMVLETALDREREQYQEELAQLRGANQEKLERLELARLTDHGEVKALRNTLRSYETRVGLLDAKRQEKQELWRLQEQQYQARISVLERQVQDQGKALEICREEMRRLREEYEALSRHNQETQERQENFDVITRAWEEERQQMRDALQVAQKTQTRARKHVKTAAVLERLSDGQKSGGLASLGF